MRSLAVTQSPQRDYQLKLVQIIVEWDTLPRINIVLYPWRPEETYCHSDPSEGLEVKTSASCRGMGYVTPD